MSTNMFVNALYTFENKKTGTPESCITIYRDATDGRKKFILDEEPKITYYVTKDIEKQKSMTPDGEGYEYRYISLDDVKPVTCRYKDLYRSMAANTTNQKVKKLFKENSGSAEGWRKIKETIHMFPEFHGTDANITDFYIDKFCQENDQEKCTLKLQIGAFDIEVAGAEYEGFPDEDIAPCEVNMITYYNDTTNILTVYMLKYDTDTYRELVEKNIKTKVKEIKQLYTKYLGDFKIKARTFGNELSLIAGFFQDVNNDKPDYMLAWNARFDILTLFHRLEKLCVGEDFMPEDIMCPEDFPVKRVIIRKDDSIKANKDFTARTDVFNIYGYTVWLDMMVLYGNITRPQGKKDSYTLNAIGLEETGLGKEDLSADDTSIKTAYIDNYTTFWKYSCIDTLLLMLIIKNTGYVELLHTIVGLTRTRANKALTKTVCLRNYVNVFYREMGYVISNNRSYLHDDGRTGIGGAYVAPPELIEFVGKINGIPSNKCFDLVIDEDLSSMYPSILIVFNISSSTADMKITVKYHTGKFEVVVDNNGKQHKKEIIEDRTKEYMENYLSEDTVSYCAKYHNLPDYEEMYNIFVNAV